MEIKANRTRLGLFAESSSFLNWEYWSICSWQKGHPNDLVSTTRDTPPSDERSSDTGIGDPSSLETVDSDNARMGSTRRARAEGVPDTVVASPHSRDRTAAAGAVPERRVVAELGRGARTPTEDAGAGAKADAGEARMAASPASSSRRVVVTIVVVTV
mmetsp:Transcript_18361/g.33140  ORF Transcript_18361/g.33140 Transcript_18361/m.33140 type:complete len:158 (+) Transcript_18361:797-1270(+)